MAELPTDVNNVRALQLQFLLSRVMQELNVLLLAQERDPFIATVPPEWYERQKTWMNMMWEDLHQLNQGVFYTQRTNRDVKMN